MRDQFAGYYPPSPSELSDLWTRGIVAIDANALLNLYRYTDATRVEFIAALRNLAPRIWLPHHAGLEFHRRRLDVIEDQAGAYEALLTGFRSAHGSIAEPANRYRRHPRLNNEDILDQFDRAVAPLVSNIESARDEFRASMPSSPHDDPILSAVTDLFSSHVGEAFTDQELAAIYEEGASRYETSTPPGFRDAKKEAPDRYGDLVIWKEILRKGALDSAPMIFVTDDRKDDWWWEHRGRTVGPRVELVEEYKGAAGCRVHFYTPESFLRVTRSRNPTVVSEEAIGEVEAVSRQETYNRARVIVAERLNELLHRRALLQSQLSRIQSAPRGTDRVAFAEAQLLDTEENMVLAQRRFEDLRRRVDAAQSLPDQIEARQRLSEAKAEIDSWEDRHRSALSRVHRLKAEPNHDRSEFAHLARQLRAVEDGIAEAERVLVDLDQEHPQN